MRSYVLPEYRDLSHMAFGREWFFTRRRHRNGPHYSASVYYCRAKFFNINLTIRLRSWSIGWTKPRRG